MAFQYLKGTHRKDQTRLFTRVCSDRTQRNGLKRKENRFRFDIKEKLFTVTVVRQLNRLPHGSYSRPSLMRL